AAARLARARLRPHGNPAHLQPLRVLDRARAGGAAARVGGHVLLPGAPVHARRVQGRAVTRRAAAIAALGATATLAASAPAAADQRISASPRDQYANPTVTIDQGERVTFFNGDVLDEHSVTATTAGPDGRPLFDSGVIQPGAEVPVVGVQSLTAGTYEFFCTVHHFMRGTITVTGTGTPVPRPPDTTPARPTV